MQGLIATDIYECHVKSEMSVLKKGILSYILTVHTVSFMHYF